MKTQLSWFCGVSVVVAGIAALGASHQSSTAESMAKAGRDFVASLDAEQREATLFPFTQDNWEKWHYIPMRNRTGLRYDRMTDEQVRLANALIASCTSQIGYDKVQKIMALEDLLLLNDLAMGRTVMNQLRNEKFYYFAVFGEPSADGLWGWRVEGHHISIHFAMKDGGIIAHSPMFYGCEPHHVLEGDRKGLRVLGDEEDAARALLASLDTRQRRQAILSEKAPGDVFTRASRQVDFGSVDAEGVLRSDMSDGQKQLLRVLIDEYIENVPPDLAAERAKRVADSGDDIRFAWMGDTEPGIGHPHYYRVHGKLFLIEYDNFQNQANHSHTVWRDYNGDFGRDVLAEHYSRSH